MRRRPRATLAIRVATTFVRRVVVLVRSLADETRAFPLAPGLRHAVLAGAGLEAYLALRPEQRRADVAERLARGDLCFAVLDEDRVVHATWASTVVGPLPYLDADVALDGESVCFYDSYTDPAWRGRDVSRSRDEAARRHYRAAGVARSVALIARENGAGLRVTEPLGYRAIGEYGLLRAGPLRLRWRSTRGGEPLPRLVPRTRRTASPPAASGRSSPG